MTSKVRNARLQLAEKVISEVMGAPILAAVRKLKPKNSKRTLSDVDDKRGRHPPSTPDDVMRQKAAFERGSGRFMNRGRSPVDPESEN